MMDRYKWIKNVEIMKKREEIPTQIRIRSPNETVYAIETDDDGKLKTKKLPKPKTIPKEI